MRKRIVIFSHSVSDVHYLPKNICVENERKKITIVFFLDDQQASVMKQECGRL